MFCKKQSWSRRMLRACCNELEDRDYEYRHLSLGPAGLILLRLNADRVRRLKKIRAWLAKRVRG
jgi:hypothetical protein